MGEGLFDILAWVIPVLSAVILHELAHGWAARLLGDDTALRAGRLSLNPLRHIDPVGSVLFPALLIAVSSPLVFGSAKPVPVNFTALSPARRGMAAVALAGPAANIALAIVASLLLHLEAYVPPEDMPWLYTSLYRALMLNCVLATFNLLPLLPLDGGRVLAACLRGRYLAYWQRTERFGLPIIVILLIVPIYFGYDAMNALLLAPTFRLLELVLILTGNSG